MQPWIPAFAGMTEKTKSLDPRVRGDDEQKPSPMTNSRLNATTPYRTPGFTQSTKPATASPAKTDLPSQ
ncbi:MULTISPECIES: hypothetical protein [Lysobacter]|jgi:hypothetical protein|uniref:Uncharacterized protein n=1 Tax=Lysobacter gummosus TaxID=262324 RepID=A0ABY3XD72_9GAMM|nr:MULTISPECIES: hypothetical protein [Lysobacter]MBT2749487.1 hypothetical protein [Lysobacter sp. ISL-42]MBT2753942.1 hypothetical protein [Lysobacter sp. ISL-50]MBT2779417.1 hypothetical protein [Lysobacter sp. ISL-54]MBT2782355.1 hypothetical protein [Lysobacter sp. ISL-52]UJB20827.1 hypothetical protein L1A79_07105 [Lysobacter capsici]